MYRHRNQIRLERKVISLNDFLFRYINFRKYEEKISKRNVAVTSTKFKMGLNKYVNLNIIRKVKF